ncbi:MAG: oligosaccharide flippase family protein [Lentisphaerae bacterium]|nr:oligosaccharide flippase family protein [Lentisphaerota bacterium]
MIKPLQLWLRRLQERLGPLWWYTLLGFIVNRLGDVINIFIGLYLVPRLLPGEDLGALLPLMTVGAVFSTPLALLLLPVSKFLSIFAAREETGKIRALLQDSLGISLVYAVIMTAWIFWQGDALLLRLHVTDHRLLWPVAGFAILVCVEPIISGAVRALRLFKPMLLSGLIAPYVRLAGMLALLVPLGALGYLLAQFATQSFGVLFSLVILIMFLRKTGRRVSYRPHLREMLAYSLPLVAFTLVGRIQGPIETFVIRHRLPTVDSAGYYYAFMLGNIPGYFTGAMAPFLWPILSDRFERGQKTEGLLMQSMLFNLALGALFVGLFALIMPWFFTLPSPWQPYKAYAGFVWQAALIGTLKTAQSFYTSHETACRRFTYMRYLIPLILIECAILYALPGWSALRPWLPTGLWNWVAARYRPSLQGFVAIMLMANAAFTCAMLIEWFVRSRRARSSSIAVDSNR